MRRRPTLVTWSDFNLNGHLCFGPDAQFLVVRETPISTSLHGSHAWRPRPAAKSFDADKPLSHLSLRPPVIKKAAAGE
jgi:hypothetical protein